MHGEGYYQSILVSWFTVSFPAAYLDIMEPKQRHCVTL
jgi:hypothetical protein